MASSEQSLNAGLVGWALVLSFFMSPCSPFIAPPSIVSQRVLASIHGHGSASNSLTSPPSPAPTGHGPRPARPKLSASAPPWRTWVSGDWIPLASHPCLRLSSSPTFPPSWVSSPFSCLCLPASVSQIHVPFPASPFLARLQRGALRSSLPLLPQPGLCNGQALRHQRGAWIKRLWEGRG